MVCIEYNHEILYFRNVSLAVNFLKSKGLSDYEICCYTFVHINGKV